VAAPAEILDDLESGAKATGVMVLVIGTAGGENVTLSAGETEVSISLADATRAWRSLGERLGDAVSA
jgi:hypothetical protein